MATQLRARKPKVHIGFMIINHKQSHCPENPLLVKGAFEMKQPPEQLEGHFWAKRIEDGRVISALFKCPSLWMKSLELITYKF